jgi:hypothetical protein
MKGPLDILLALGDSHCGALIPPQAFEKEPFEWPKWAFVTGLITEAEFRTAIGLPAQPPSARAGIATIPPKFTPSPEARCSYCRTIADHPTHCQSCGAPR